MTLLVTQYTRESVIEILVCTQQSRFRYVLQEVCELFVCWRNTDSIIILIHLWNKICLCKPSLACGRYFTFIYLILRGFNWLTFELNDALQMGWGNVVFITTIEVIGRWLNLLWRYWGFKPNKKTTLQVMTKRHKTTCWLHLTREWFPPSWSSIRKKWILY